MGQKKVMKLAMVIEIVYEERDEREMELYLAEINSQLPSKIHTHTLYTYQFIESEIIDIKRKWD